MTIEQEQPIKGGTSGSALAHPPLWLLVLITLSGTMAMHIFVPALPVAGKALGASASSMQQTITLYVVGLALGQLIYGPLSDAYGRRPMLVAGLSIYCLSSMLALCAPSVEWLVLARLLQALGGAAGITLGRAIIQDTSAPDRVTKDLALLNMLTLVGPGAAPIVGAYLADHFGWRSVYVFLVGIGACMWISAVRQLPETHLQRRPLRLRTVLADYRTLLTHPQYLAYMLGGACATTALYPYLASVSYIVHEQMHIPIQDVGWFAGSTVLGATTGTALTRRLSQRWPTQRFLYLGAGLSLTMAVLFLLTEWIGALTPVSLLAVTITMTLGAGMASPAALSKSLSSLPGLTGAAAGVYGFGQMAMGALGTFVVGFGNHPVVSCAVTQIVLTGTALGCFLFAGSKVGRSDF